MIKKLPRNRQDLIEIFESSEIEPNNIILFHSNTFRWFVSLSKGGEKDPLGAIIDSLLKYMSKEGTVLFPLFNFAFCSTGFFDYNKTPSKMGSLTERARHDIRFNRTYKKRQGDITKNDIFNKCFRGWMVCEERERKLCIYKKT